MRLRRGQRADQRGLVGPLTTENDSKNFARGTARGFELGDDLRRHLLIQIGELRARPRRSEREGSRSEIRGCQLRKVPEYPASRPRAQKQLATRKKPSEEG